MPKLTFMMERTDSWETENPDATVILSLENVESLDEVYEEFDNFLRGCGWIVPWEGLNEKKEYESQQKLPLELDPEDEITEVTVDYGDK